MGVFVVGDLLKSFVGGLVSLLLWVVVDWLTVPYLLVV